MKFPGLPALFLALSFFGLTASAEPFSTPDPKVVASLQALKDFESALAALQPPAAYTLDQRHLVSVRLINLEEKLSFVQLPSAERTPQKDLALERLRAAVADAQTREAAFWAAEKSEAPNKVLSAATADPLRVAAAAMRKAFDELVPLPVPAGESGRTVPGAGNLSVKIPTVAARTATRTQSDARRSIDNPNAFFDNSSANGGLGNIEPEAGSSGVIASNRGLTQKDQGVAPVMLSPKISDLRVGPVPVPQQESIPVIPTRAAALLTAGAPAANATITTAQSTPLVGPLVSTREEPPAGQQKPAPNPLCRQAAGGGTFANLCGLPGPMALLGPAASGFMDSMFSLGGLGNLVVSLLLGVLIPALTGGVGLVFTVIKALLGVTAVLAIGALLYKIVTLLGQLFSLPQTDPRHWAAAKQLGGLCAQLLIAVAGLIGGAAIGRATGATNAIRAGLTSIQARLAASGAADAASSGIASQLRGLGDGETPYGGRGSKSNVEPPGPPPDCPPGSVCGPVSRRPFNPDKAGGPIRSMSAEQIKITDKGVDVVERHIARFEAYGPNRVMISRLRAIAKGELEPTETDRNYYAHELREYVRYRRLGHPTGAGDDSELWNNAHTATLEDYGINERTPNILYHPDAEAAK